ncbi:MAG: M56 family metallopeptidase [Gemmatimonadales bacterium]
MTIILAAVAWLLTYLVHSTLFLLGATALSALGLVRSAAARDTLWKVALVGGVLTATTQMVLRLQPRIGHVALAVESGASRVDVAQVRTIRPAATESAPSGASFASAIAQHDIGEIPPLPPARTFRRVLSGINIGWPAMLLNLWLVGAVAFSLRLLWTRVGLARRLRGRRLLTAGPLWDQLQDLCGRAGVPAPRLTVSDRLKGPIAFGREICIPERVPEQLRAAEQRAVLAHELGHIVRRDPAWLTLAAFLESICCIQPLNRLARRRMREASEYLCDDWAAERAGGLVLARCLAQVAEWMQGQPAAEGVASMAGRCSELVNRVERLLEGAAPARPAQLLIRVSAGLLALTAVAWSVPGVSAEDIGDAREVTSVAEVADAAFVTPVVQGTTWGEVRDDGRMIVFLPGFSARLTGQGRIGFRQYGRAIVLADGYTLKVGGEAVTGSMDLCESMGSVRIEGPGGGWDVAPVRLVGAPRYVDGARTAAVAERAAEEAVRATAESLTAEHIAELDAARAQADAATDAALDGEVDVAIDTLVQMWVRDPDAVRRAARRIARTYDRDLRPQFESLGVQLGRELAPQLQRLTNRAGRDLTPEFQRMGAAIGASIVQSLGDLRDDDSIAPKRTKLPSKH